MPKRRVEGEITVSYDPGPSSSGSRSPVDSPQSACSSGSRSNLRRDNSWNDREPLLPVHTKQATNQQRTPYGSFLRKRGSQGDMEQKPAKLPLVDTSGRLNVERRGVPKLTAYWSDLFHTLINSAMTIGFGGELVPDPDCFTLNLLIALQSLAALIVAYALLGIVYTRFALPSRRASSLVFSHCMVLNEEDGVPRLSFRVANVRKHQLIEAHAQLLVAINNIMSAENEALFKFSNLPILGGGFVFLALPCVITHAITKHSPLHGMSLAMMERADIEFLVLIEGVDAPTSAKLQAPWSGDHQAESDAWTSPSFMTFSLSQLPFAAPTSSPTRPPGRISATSPPSPLSPAFSATPLPSQPTSVWSTPHVGAWSMEATAEAAASRAVVLAPVAVAAASTAVIAGGGDAAATVGTPAGSAAQAHVFEGRKQMRRMVRRGSTERCDRIGGGMTTEQGRLSRRVSFEVSPVAELVGEGRAQQGAEVTAGRECASVAHTAAVLDGGWSRRHEGCKELTQGADRHNIEEMVVETPNKKGRMEQRDSGGRRHGRAFSEPAIPVPSSKRNSASSRSSMSGGIGVGGRRSSGASKQGRSSGASGLPGCWTDQSPLLLMNSFSVRSASHMLEMDARHRIAVAEKREQQWRALAVDLAMKVQSSKTLHAPDVDCHPLLNRAKESSCVAPATILSEVTNVDSIPVLSRTEVAERLAGHKHPNQQNYRAFYSSVIGGITKDPAAMVIPIDDHMAHRGHAVFDTAIICSGYLYELDEHVDRFIKSARAARIEHSYSREELKAIIIQTVAASGVRDGSTRYWLSVGPGGFTLSTKECPRSTFYVMVVADNKFTNLEAPVAGVTVATSSVPMKAPMFSTMKNVNYMPNSLVKKEAEERGVFEGIWIDENGNVGEGPSMNVAFVNDKNEFLVPEFSRVLAGCTMKRVLALAEELLKEDSVPRISRICHRPVSEAEARQCNEMMLVGSGVLVTPVIQWDDQIIASGSPGAITMALRKLLAADLHEHHSRIQVN
ncbi:unnamed protein product [Closterium sp. Yama58-4]|nr:unnamed protein product [Closterium sp. Yama58-4]